jgi:hypothetical protein
MNRVLERNDVILRLEKAIKTAGSAKALADGWNISSAYLCDVRHGRRNPGPLILDALELEECLTYRERTR